MNCSLCRFGADNKCNIKECDFEEASEYQLLHRFFYEEYPDEKELIQITLKEKFNRIVESHKFRSKGEKEMYLNYILRYFTSPDIIIHQEAQLNKYGCPRALRADFLICNKWDIPLAVIEVNGTQHYTDTKVMERDEYKSEWCHKNCIGYLYGDWNGYSLNFERWEGFTGKLDWQATEEFEECLRAINELGGINKTINERKQDREIAYREYAKYIRECLDAGINF